LLLTVYCLFINKFRRGQGAPVFVEGGAGACATAQWHNGQSKPECSSPEAVASNGRSAVKLQSNRCWNSVICVFCLLLGCQHQRKWLTGKTRLHKGV